MGFLMNEFDVTFAVDTLAAHRPGTGWDEAAALLSRYVWWVNSVSDGWPYWSAGSNAARKLQEAILAELDAIRRGFVNPDLDPDTLNRLIRPMKACMTRNGSDWKELL